MCLQVPGTPKQQPGAPKTASSTATTAPLIRAAVEQCPDYRPGCPELVDCADFTAAVHAAAEGAHSGDIVLMSPASAAFDQFKNFMVRGEYFKKLIMEL